MEASSSEHMKWEGYEMTVPWHESDPAGIAFHGIYLFWLERAFLSFLTNRGYDVEKRGLVRNVGFPVTRVECQYLKPLPVWSRINVFMELSPRSNLTKLVLPFTITLLRTGETAAEGEIQRRIVSLDSFQVVECPDELRGIFGFP